ncbi:PHP domain-containing protein [Clostridium sp.]|uniref:PHP domain-containing protein n=1 Tax=Clostridium sp. TaxID=1506 RepID=UPI003F675652
MYTKGDFHMHTIESDGDYTPTEVVIMAKESGLDVISITDHNTTNGVEEAIKAGEWLGVKVIPGMELSTRFNGKKTHILGYFTNDIYKDKDFSRCLRYIKKHNIRSLQAIIGNSYENIDRKNVNKAKLDTETGIDFLRYFGACVVLAHPIRIKGGILNQVLNLNFDGIEAIYSKNSSIDTEHFKNIAREKGWIYTAGSDFHSDLRVDSRHGSIGQVHLNSEEIELLISKCVVSNLKS